MGIWSVSSKGGSPERLLPTDPGAETDPNYSPDGRQIVFSNSEEAGRNQNCKLLLLDVATRKVVDLPGSKGMYSPRWSPDGRLIATETFDSDSLHLYDFGKQQWTERYRGELAFPVWSADSSSLYFMTYRSDPGIFRLRVAGASRSALWIWEMYTPLAFTASGSDSTPGVRPCSCAMPAATMCTRSRCEAGSSLVNSS